MNVPFFCTGLLSMQDEAAPNNFLVMVGRYAEKASNPATQRAALLICQELKEALNLDRHPALFKAERSYSEKPKRRTIKLPG